MKCPDCGIEIGSLPCWRCEREALDHEWEFKSLIKKFSLVRGPPENRASRSSLNFALLRIQKRLEEEQFHMTVSYEPQDLLRSKTWWYIPYRWIGCRGFIVNMDDGYVNWLGSALSLQHCFWGHERGVVCDLVDFTFAPDTDPKLAERLLPRFKHMHRDEHGVLPSEPVWYREVETSAAVSNQFPTFRRHFVWFAIPDLFNAYEKEGLRFNCALFAGAEQGAGPNERDRG
jgi:hypothetical protein